MVKRRPHKVKNISLIKQESFIKNIHLLRRIFKKKTKVVPEQAEPLLNSE
jgi:hypothetical protein